ncbi:MAG TPA: hypothetical protein VF331_25845 [Polyangiales bacterium]
MANLPGRQLEVMIVADNPETIEGLRAYFNGVGVASQGRRDLRDPSAVTATTTAVVIFPDELVEAAVVRRILALRSTRPELPIVLVTGAPQRFQAALAADDRSLPPIVLPRPAFGWTILDTIRAHAHAERS